MERACADGAPLTAVWREWDSDDVDGPELWCVGWSLDREPLKITIMRSGWADHLGGARSAMRLAQEATLKSTWAFFDNDAEEWHECDNTQPGATAVTFAFLSKGTE